MKFESNQRLGQPPSAGLPGNRKYFGAKLFFLTAFVECPKMQKNKK